MLNSKLCNAPLALLLVLAWSGAATGATSVPTRCDPYVRAQDMPDSSPASLSIEVVDHSPARSSRLHDDAPRVEIEGAKLGPTVEVLLRRIFDGPRLRPVDTSQTSEVDEMAAPMTVEQAETREEAASRAESEEVRETPAGLPGVSQDDLIRFKRQMYRKDI